MNAINGDKVVSMLKEEHKSNLHGSHEKLVLTGKLDKTIDRKFVMEFIHSSGSQHLEFYKGSHANLY